MPSPVTADVASSATILGPAGEAGRPTGPSGFVAGAVHKVRQEIPFSEGYAGASLDGGCTGSQVGRYTRANSPCLDLGTGAFTNGTFVKTASNAEPLFPTTVTLRTEGMISSAGAGR